MESEVTAAERKRRDRIETVGMVARRAEFARIEMEDAIRIARAAGASLRAIAQAAGMSHEQVRRERYRRPQFAELPETVPSRDETVNLVHARERLRAVLAADLTPVERTAIGRAARGEPCTEKRLDNALHRARRKLSLLAQAPERVEAS